MHLQDASLSPRARVLMMYLAPAITQQVWAAALMADVAKMLGCCEREALRVTRELERAQIVTSRRRQRAPKQFSWGPAVAFNGAIYPQTVSLAPREDLTPPSAQQSFNFRDSKSAHIKVRARVARLRNSNPSPSASRSKNNDDDPRACAREKVGSSSLSFLKHLGVGDEKALARLSRSCSLDWLRDKEPAIRAMIDRDVTASTAVRLVRDFNASQIEPYLLAARELGKEPGWLVQAIVGQWVLGKRERAAIRKACPPDAAAERAREERALIERRERERREVDRYFKTLQADEVRAIRERVELLDAKFLAGASAQSPLGANIQKTNFYRVVARHAQSKGFLLHADG